MKFAIPALTVAKETLLSSGTIMVPCGDSVSVGMLVLKGRLLVSFSSTSVAFEINEFKSIVPGDGDFVRRRYRRTTQYLIKFSLAIISARKM
jgi:hypothetical protein